MSRIGRMPIAIPSGVEVKIDGHVVTVKGAKATLTREIHPNMNVAVEGNEILVTRPNDDKQNRALHGLTRSLIHNMVVGVTDGFKKELSVQGVGYRVAKQGKDLVMNLGYSHQVTMSETDGITIDVPNPNTIIISGPDKQKVGQFAAEVREKRPPEPYIGIDSSYLLVQGNTAKHGEIVISLVDPLVVLVAQIGTIHGHTLMCLDHDCSGANTDCGIRQLKVVVGSVTEIRVGMYMHINDPF